MAKYTNKGQSIILKGGRKYVSIGQETMSLSKAIKEITGWNTKKFETEKRLMRQRVSNFNMLTGANLSPIEELYFKAKFQAQREYYASKGKQVKPFNELQTAIRDMSTSKISNASIDQFTTGGIEAVKSKAFKRQYEIAKDYILSRYEGLGRNFVEAQRILDDLEADRITTMEANKQLQDFAEEMRNLKDENPLKWQDMHGDTIDSPL